jgi:outer membrane receptor protein involved in Fe transport
MTCRPSLFVLAAVTVALCAPRIEAQELAMAKPRFIATWVAPGEPDDASGASVLQRRVSLDLRDVPMGVALRQVASQAGLDLSYDKSVLPVARRVSLHAQELTVVAALTEILVESGLDVAVGRGGQLGLVRKMPAAAADSGAVAGRVTDAKTGAAVVGATVILERTSLSASTDNDGRYRIHQVAPGTYTVRARYIGYAPGSASVTVKPDQEATADFALEKSVQRLDEVVTTGTVVPTAVKALPTPISVITAEDIERQNIQRVDQVFRGQVPGAIAWDPGPIDDFSAVMVRGASSLGSDRSIKTFIDGVEVADPTRIATIDPNSIDRIEITRGPEASTLYGAGALNGVMQIFTKKGRPGLKRPEVTAKLSAGGVGGYDGQGTAIETDNALSVLGGAAQTSYTLGGWYSHMGQWAPSYRSSGWGGSGGGQTTQGRLTLSGSVRYVDKSRDYPWDTRLQSYVGFNRPNFQTNRIRQQTVGVTASLEATHNWHHTITLGYDQTYYDYHQTQARFTTPDDSFLVALAQHQAKTSLMYHTDVTLHLGAAVAATVTGGVNHDAYDDVESFTRGATRTVGNLDGSTVAAHNPWTNTGYFAQAQFDLAERLFLTGGLRAERNDNFGADFGTAWSPRVGASYVVGRGPATLKLRASYGEGIRAPLPGQRGGQQLGYAQYLPNPALAPERQRGGDGGIDFYWGRASLSATYYSQRALNLIDLITIPTQPDALSTYQYQNISRVKNEGWEFMGQLPLGPVQVAATYAITNSTIQQLPADYPPGGYQIGDQILATPRSSAGASVTYSPLPHTTLTASMTHIGHWTNWDFMSYFASLFSGGQPYLQPARAFWIEYPTVTKFAVGASQALTTSVTAFVHVENLGNNLRSEQVNTNIPTPRGVLIGANVQF